MNEGYLTPNAVNEEAQQAIKDYCTKRNFKCIGCRYSIKFIASDASKTSTCIFGNCPCSWKIDEK